MISDERPAQVQVDAKSCSRSEVGCMMDGRELTPASALWQEVGDMAGALWRWYNCRMVPLVRLASLAVMLFAVSPAGAEPMTVRQVSQILVKAAPESAPDLSNADLGGLDLSD